MVNIHYTPFPILTTERLLLRQLTTDDREGIFALRSHPEINKYLGRQPSKTIEDAINFINTITENIQKTNSIYWVITFRETKTFAGTICLFNFLHKDYKCEIGYELLTGFQGHGVMEEAAKKVISYAFETTGLKKIEAFTHNGNTNSTKLLEKLHFIKSIEADKEYPDFHVFTLTKSL